MLLLLLLLLHAHRLDRSRRPRTHIDYLYSGQHGGRDTLAGRRCGQRCCSSSLVQGLGHSHETSGGGRRGGSPQRWRHRQLLLRLLMVEVVVVVVVRDCSSRRRLENELATVRRSSRLKILRGHVIVVIISGVIVVQEEVRGVCLHHSAGLVRCRCIVHRAVLRSVGGD